MQQTMIKPYKDRNIKIMTKTVNQSLM